jgi:hypothetical protein
MPNAGAEVFFDYPMRSLNEPLLYFVLECKSQNRLYGKLHVRKQLHKP